MIESLYLPPLYDHIAALLKTSHAYLVGGAVRDLLLKRTVHDLDFALPAETIQTARKVADKLGGAFYVMDQERQTARVILRDEEGKRMMIDFTRFQGETIEDDLRARDFTITSMALNIQEPINIIDPFLGAQDLKDRLLRTTSESALGNDPLRCIRAVRLAAQFDLRITPETKTQIRHNQTKLAVVSPERIRDELFRILEGPNQTAAIQSLQVLGLLKYILPGEYAPDLVKTIRSLEEIWTILLKPHDQHSAANWSLGLLVHSLGRYRAEIKTLLAEEPVPDRSIYQLSYLVPFMVTQLNNNQLLDSTGEIREKLQPSNQEMAFLENCARSAGEFQQLIQMETGPLPLDVYRYYRSFGSAGVVGVYLALADFLGKQIPIDQQTGWTLRLDRARVLLDGWWERHAEWVNPPVLLDGNDLQLEYGILPGPRIGELLEFIREAQVKHCLESREQARSFLEDLLQDNMGQQNDKSS